MRQLAMWLQTLARRLIKTTRFKENPEPQPHQATSESLVFFLEIIQCITNPKEGSKELVYKFLATNLTKLNHDLLNAIPTGISILLNVVDIDNPADIFIVISKFGDLMQGFPLGQRAINMELAIAAYQQSLQMVSQDATLERGVLMNNLAAAYRNRIYGDRTQNIEEAIAAYQQSLQMTPRETTPVDWAKTMMNLAIAYNERIRGNREQNLEKAIDTYQQSLQVLTRETTPDFWAQTMMSLAVTYIERIQGNRTQNLEKSIDAFQQSLQVITLEAMPTLWAGAMMNLAKAYMARLQGDRAQNLEKSIDTLQQSLQVMTREAMPTLWAKTMTSLAIAYYERIQGNDEENIAKAIAACESALDILRPELLPDDCRFTAQLLGDLYTNQKCWSKANQAYTKAIDAAEILYQAALLHDSQEAELSTTRDLFHRAALAQAKTEQFTKAVTTLERGRARGVSEALERDRRDLADIENSHPEIYEQYKRAAETIRQLEADEHSTGVIQSNKQPTTSEAELRQQAKIARQEIRKAIADLRQIPGYTNFFDQPDFSDVVAAIMPGQALIYLSPNISGSLVLIVYQPETCSSGAAEISSLLLDALTDKTLQELLTGSEEKICGYFGAYYQQSSDREGWFRAINETTRKLWDLIMGPVIEQLEVLGISQAVLVPTGLLGFLPLHAAWKDDPEAPTGRRYALDTVTFTYAPNARSLQAAQAIGEKTAANSLLAINEPRPTSASPLPGSAREVDVAIDYFQENYHVLKYEQAMRDAALAALPNHGLLHFSCHGYVNFADPLNSGFLMANDEILSLRDFFNINLQGVRLAILSACETGLPGAKLPDEVMSLPTGLLKAGVAGVAASLWSVSDVSTMMLIVLFYDYWQNKRLAPAQALRQAQQWVRDTPNGEKEAYFKDSIPELEGSRMPYTAASSLYQSLAFSDPNANDLAHPYYWAAFTYFGV